MADISHYTEARANIIIEALASGLQPITAAEMAGISRMTAYNWRNRYPEFAERWADAISGATEHVEEVVWKHAASGNLAAAFFWLRSHKPQLYDRATMAKIAMLKSILQSQASKGGGRLTIDIDENGIPQIVENTSHQTVRIYMPDNGRDKREIDGKAETSPEPSEPEPEQLSLEIPEPQASEPSELAAPPPTNPKPQGETVAQAMARYGLINDRPPASNVYALDRWKALSE